MRKQFLTLLLLGLLCSIGNAWADVTVGLTTTLSTTSGKGGDRVYTGVTDRLTVTKSDGTSWTTIEEKSNQAVKYKSNTNQYTNEVYRIKTSASDYSSANYIGYSVVVASGYIFNISQIDASIAVSANLPWKIEIENGSGTVLYTNNGVTITNYNSSSATNEDFSANVSKNANLQSLTGTIYVKVYTYWSSTGKYFCFPKLNLIGTVEASTPTLTGAWILSEEDVTGETANVVQGGSATMPTFTVGATSGSPTAADNYTVAYELKEGSTAGIFTITDGVPTAISTTTAGSATIIATLTTKDASSFLEPATNTFEYSVTVSAAAPPSFTSVTPTATNVVRGTESSIVAVVAGTPTPTIQWYSNTTASNEGGEAIDKATNLTLSLTNTTVGTFYYYAVATNTTAQENNVASSVQTITVNPKAPTITASKSFVESQSVTIAKADGEAGAATIKYKVGSGDWQDYSEALSVTETSTITAKVVQSGLESAEVSATYTKVDLYTQTVVSEETTWDWSTFNTTIQLKDDGTTTPAKAEDSEMVAANYDGVRNALDAKWPNTFNATALIMNKTEYPTRNGYYQGHILKIETTVPGTIVITYRNTSNREEGNGRNVYVTVNGENGRAYGEYNISKTDYSVANIPVSAGVIEMRGNNETDQASNYLQIKILKFIPAHTRSVSAGQYGTICLPYAVAAGDFSGATFHSIEGVTKSGDDITGVVLSDAVSSLTAGTPYIFYAESEGTLTAYMSGAAASVQAATGLVGNLSSTPASVPTGNYILYKKGGDTSYKVYTVDASATVTCPQYRAYIDLSGVGEVSAPGRRVIELGNEENNATNLENIESADKAVKFIENGTLYILRDGAVYDALGRLIR